MKLSRTGSRGHANSMYMLRMLLLAVLDLCWLQYLKDASWGIGSSWGNVHNVQKHALKLTSSCAKLHQASQEQHAQKPVRMAWKLLGSTGLRDHGESKSRHLTGTGENGHKVATSPNVEFCVC